MGEYFELIVVSSGGSISKLILPDYQKSSTYCEKVKVSGGEAQMKFLNLKCG
jgi:hypothetical protein